MKIRSGFVSNSSSSSFLIYGTILDQSELKELFFTQINDDPELQTQYTKDLLTEELDDDLDYFEIMERVSSALPPNFVIESPYDGDTFFIGRSWDSVGDDETGRQFKRSVEDTINALIENRQYDTHTEAWYDG